MQYRGPIILILLVYSELCKQVCLPKSLPIFTPFCWTGEVLSFSLCVAMYYSTPCFSINITSSWRPSMITPARSNHFIRTIPAIPILFIICYLVLKLIILLSLPPLSPLKAGIVFYITPFYHDALHIPETWPTASGRCFRDHLHGTSKNHKHKSWRH